MTDERDAASENALLAEQFTRLFTHGLLPMAVCRTNGDVLHANEAFCRMLGRSEEWLHSHSFNDLSAPEGHAEDALYLAKVRSAGGSYVRRKAYLHADGHPVWCEVHVSSVNVPQTGETELVVLARDIAELIADGEELDARNRRRDLSQAAAHVGTWETSTLTSYRYWSDEMKRLHLLSPEDPTPTFEEFLAQVHPDDRELVLATLADHKPYRIEYRWLAEPDNVRVLVDSGDTTVDAEGRIIWQTGTTIDVTDERRGQEALRATTRLLDKVFESALLATAVFDLDGRFVRVNDAFCDFLGRPRSWFDEHTAREIGHPDDRARDLAQLRSVAEGRSLLRPERYIHADGGLLWGETSLQPLVSEGSDSPYVLIQVRDITAALEAERQLQQQQRRLEATQEAGHVGTWDLDLSTDSLTYSAEFGRLHGIDPGQTSISFEEWLGYVHPDDRAELTGAVGSGEDRLDEYRARRGDETLVLVSRATYLPGEDGHPGYRVGVTWDVTEERAAQAAIRHADLQFRRLFDTSPIGMLVRQLDGPVIQVNEAYCRMLGHTREDMLKLSATPELLTHPDDVEADAAALDALRRGETSWYVRRKRYRHADGHWLWVEVSIAEMRADENSPRELTVQARDITAAVASEQALRHAEERFRRGFDTSLLGMMLFAAGGRRYYVNDALCAMLGYDREVLLGLSLDQLSHPDDLAEDARLIDSLLADEFPNYVRQKRLRHADGHFVWVEASVARMDFEHGSELVAHIRDITESLGYEQQLRHLAEHDHLTGLLNRRAFEQRVGEFATATGGREGALLLLDLDGFKHHNDTFGHAVGDAILVSIAAAMCDVVPSDAVVGRQGGDEFAVLVPDQSLATQVAEKLLTAISGAAATVSPDAEHPVTVSIGIAPFRGDPDLDQTMLRADEAMYAAKQGGRNRVALATR